MATQRVCPSCRQRTEEPRCPACGVPTVDERALRGEDPIGRVVGGRYRIEALLGRGGMGAVYRARNLDLDSPVALKLMRRESVEDLESIERFYCEARAASRLPRAWSRCRPARTPWGVGTGTRGGRDRAYAWGNEKPDCSMAVMDDGRNGCGRSAAWSVCSRPDGRTADGLCDRSGNVAEWLQDVFHKTYEGAPSNGRPWEGPGTHGRVVRGGSWYAGPDGVRTTFRDDYPPGHRSTRVGIRLARDAR